VANQILDAAVDADEGDRQARLRARAASVGRLRSGSDPAVTPARRRRIIASTRGIGPMADTLLAEERSRL